ncbi:MAG: hypothetical protein AAFS07_13880 [Pseudomonadota bacterium]
MDKEQISKIKKSLNELSDLGRKLYYKLALEESEPDFDDPPSKKEEFDTDEEYKLYISENTSQRQRYEKLKERASDIGSFNLVYEGFYTQAVRSVRALAPERLEDFKRQYRDEKRKQIDVATYCISDAIIGFRHTYGSYDRKSALPKLLTQIAIIDAVSEGIENTLFDIEGTLQAEIFDSELDGAEHLLSKGHIRAAGAVAGVVLEKHLLTVASRHGFTSRKKSPSISDFNDHLKSVGVLDTPHWRRIQSYGDIRNSCDHPRERDPKKEDVEDLISGTKRVMKELF